MWQEPILPLAIARIHPALFLRLCSVSILWTLACGSDASPTLIDGDGGADADLILDVSKPDGAGVEANLPSDAGLVDALHAQTCSANAVVASSLKWEALPGIGGDDDGASESLLMVSPKGHLYAATTFWKTPARLEVHRYVGNAWQMVGGAPVGNHRALGLAVDDKDSVLVLTSSGLFSSRDSGWQKTNDAFGIDIEPWTFTALEQDSQGRLLLLLTGDNKARVLRKEAGLWTALGDLLVSEPEGKRGNADWWKGRLAVNCAGHVAALYEGSVFLYAQDTWKSLGRFVLDHADRDHFRWAQWPRLALPPDDRPIVTWRADFVMGEPPDTTMREELIVSRYDSISARFKSVASPIMALKEGGSPAYTSVAVNNANDVFVVWRESTVVLTHLVDDALRPLIGDGAAHFPGTLPSVTIDHSRGLPFAGWSATQSACEMNQPCPPFAFGRAVLK